MRFNFPACYFGNVFASTEGSRSPFWWPGGCILTPVGFILIAFWSSGPGLRAQWGTLAHFLEKGAFWNVFSSPRAAFRHPRSLFWWPGVRILTPGELILVAFWTSGPGLRSQWGTLAHFLEKGVKKVTNVPPTGPPNGTVFGIVSIFLAFCGRYCGSLADSGFCFFCLRFLWESRKRNMHLTTVFTVPNAHYVFGSRTWFSDSLVPSGVSFGGCWIVFWWFWAAFSSPGGVTVSTHFWHHFGSRIS